MLMLKKAKNEKKIVRRSIYRHDNSSKCQPILKTFLLERQMKFKDEVRSVEWFKSLVVFLRVSETFSCVILRTIAVKFVI